MLALNGGIRIWHISDVVDMRYGKYRLLKVIEEKHLNPFNGDAYVFLSRNRKTLKILRYDCDKVVLYDISYMKGYKFLKPIFRGDELWYQLDFKYLVALLNCPSRSNVNVR